MSSSTVTQPGPVSDGLTSLVLSKRYLSCARPPHVYKLEHDIKEDMDGHGCDESTAATVADCCWSPTTTTTTAWVPAPPHPQPIVAVQARYEPSDVFTPLVFEEILQQQQQQPTAMWIRPPVEQRIGPQQQQQQQHVIHHQHQHLHHHHHHNTRQQAGHPMQHATTTVTPSTGGHQIRRPLQHLPPAAQSSLQPPANKSTTADHHQQQHASNGNKPGDLSWLVNFQVASIFEPTCNVNATAAAAAVGGCTAGNALFANDWHLREQSETSKSNSKKKTPKADQLQKPPSKIGRKPYRMPPSRLDKANKPGYTYTEMIHQALMEKKELPVAEIYQWISSHFPYFREDDERWKNSVRHNLSINPNFRKGRKSQGAGHYWRLCNIEESLGHREYSTAMEEDVSCSPQDSAELEQACKYLEGELQREDCLEDVKMHPSIDTELENEIYTNSFLISSPSKYVNEQISISNNNDFHSYSENLLEEPIDFQYYNL